MNKVLLSLFFTMLVSIVFFSCKKDENKIYYYGGSAPVLAISSSSKDDTLRISYANEYATALIFNWTNPNYLFTTGISSQDVTYTLEIDTVGSNFTNPNLKKLQIPKDLSITLTDSALNDYMLNQLGLDIVSYHHLEFRVLSNLINGSASLISNKIAYLAKPYPIPPKVTPPGNPDSSFRDGKLYITGSATPGNWMAGGDPELLSQKFTRLSATLYEITVNLTGGNSYTFVPVYGDWTNKYSIATKNDPNEVNGGDFQFQGQDILEPAVSGLYKIQVDFQRGKFIVTKL